MGGISRSKVSDTHFVYIDTNAFQGWYPGDQSDDIDMKQSGVVYGSPIIGIKEFDKLSIFAKQKYKISLRTNVILVEKEITTYTELIATLQREGYGNRLVINPSNLATLKNQEIGVFNADSIKIIEDITKFTTDGKKFAFYFLDPYGASGIPLNKYVEKIIRLPRHDVIINFPYLDLHRKTGLAQKDGLTLDLAQRLQDCDRMFGHNRWRTVADDMDAEVDQDKSLLLEQVLVDLFRDSLRNVDPNLSVKSIRMRFPDRERTMYYLFLTTHDPTGALEINEKLWNAKLMENDLRWQFKERKSMGMQMQLFPQPAPQSSDQSPVRPSKEEIAERIYEITKGHRLVLRELYRMLADEPYFVSEIKSALLLLRKQNRVAYSGDLRNQSELQFQ